MNSVHAKTIDVIGQDWDCMFGQLKAFYEMEGRWPSSTHNDKNEKKLGRWCEDQRKRYNLNLHVFSDRIKKLNSIGFLWNPMDYQWNEMFNKYKEFKEKYKREPSHSKNNCSEEKSIGMWCSKQRLRYKKHDLENDKIKMLENNQFPFTPLNKKWTIFYNKYRHFKKILIKNLVLKVRISKKRI